MHQYLDSDGSGTSPTCVSSTIGAERLQAATQWLKDNNLKGFLGELGAGSNSACISAVQGALCSMQQSGVWIGALWWAAGPWWGDVRVLFRFLMQNPVLTRRPSIVLPIHRAPKWCCRLSDPPSGPQALRVKYSCRPHSVYAASKIHTLSPIHRTMMS